MLVKTHMSRCLIVGMALAGSGCGYSLAGRGDFLPAHIKIVGIPAFENLTDRPELGELFTEKVVEEFASRGKYVVLPESLGTDAVLTGRVTSFQVVPAVLEGGEDATANQAARYTVVIRAEVAFTDTVEDKEIWADSSFSFRDEYEVGEDAEGYFDQEGMALDRLAEEFAKTLVSRILEAF
jgi:hypothetical protein